MEMQLSMEGVPTKTIGWGVGLQYLHLGSNIMVSNYINIYLYCYIVLFQQFANLCLSSIKYS
jgi:hypothetical protein